MYKKGGFNGVNEPILEESTGDLGRARLFSAGSESHQRRIAKAATEYRKNEEAAANMNGNGGGSNNPTTWVARFDAFSKAFEIWHKAHRTLTYMYFAQMVFRGGQNNLLHQIKWLKLRYCIFFLVDVLRWLVRESLSSYKIVHTHFRLIVASRILDSVLADTGKTLGQGSYATVKEAVSIRTGERFAVKVISKKLMQGREHMILNEIEILKKVSRGHKSIVTLHDFCMGGELFDQICEKGSFYEDDAAEIIKTVVDAVAYLHDQNIVHRDIKAENLLFRKKDSISELVIADFGLSKIIEPTTFDGLMTTCGTQGYMAPEVILKTGHGKPVDMWSIGVLTYFLLCGYTPFDPAEELQNILHGKYAFEPGEFWFEISLEAKDFIKHLILVDPTKRMTAKEALKHPWLAVMTVPDESSGLPVRRATVDLLPNVRKQFNAKKTFRKAVDAVRAVNMLAHSPFVSTASLSVGSSSS
ncbi:hypothetical protein HDU76_000216 [Blyttiomyces sp. JEL0837]|nr:hypothetical protein HDU76_000216 [Blyttiomyces sp. JEL0837]